MSDAARSVSASHHAVDTASTSRASNAAKPPRRRKELIKVAAQVFEVRGYEAASIQDIADSLGILKGSVYYYIDTKQELLYAVIREMHESAAANVARFAELSDDPVTLIRLFVESQFLHLTANLVAVTVFFQDFGSLDEDGRAEIVASRDNYDRFLTNLISVGQAEGSICRHIDPKIATFAILGMMNWSYQWYRVGGSLDPAEVGRQFADFALAGLTCAHGHDLGPIPPEITLGFGGMPEVRSRQQRGEMAR
jgi:AcrR family transcriptional regulator